MIIKVCGVSQSSFVKDMLQCGVHWIGMVFCPTSKRRVSLAQAIEITRITLDLGGTPVGVFLGHLADEIQMICQKTGIQVVQLHGDQARNAGLYLSDHYQRIYAFSPSESTQNFLNAVPERDFLLFDSHRSGGGVPFDWDNFNYRGIDRWFLAGGLTPENVKKGIQSLNPFGVDVSSGVEDEQGVKDIKKIQQFVREVRETL